MKYLAQKIVPAIFICLFIFSSCQPEPDDNILKQPVCNVIKLFIYDNGNVDDSATYTYTNNQVSRIKSPKEDIVFEYANNKVIKRTMFDALGSPYAYDAFIYNTDGTLKTLDLFMSNGAGFDKWGFYEFSYSAGKLSTVKEKYDVFSNGVFTEFSEYVFRYNGDNIDRCIINYKTNPDSDTLIYHYDTKPNYHQKQNTKSYFTEYLFFRGDMSGLPLVLSKNNTTMVEDNGDKILHTYVEYPNTYLKDILVDGDLVVRYFHDCK